MTVPFLRRRSDPQRGDDHRDERGEVADDPDRVEAQPAPSPGAPPLLGGLGVGAELAGVEGQQPGEVTASIATSRTTAASSNPTTPPGARAAAASSTAIVTGMSTGITLPNRPTIAWAAGRPEA
jgi:hypothetical protein